MRILPAVVFSLSAVASACARPAMSVDESSARAHIDALAGEIGSRPIGSAANARARAYVAGALTRLGFAVRLQETDAVDASRGLTAHVINIIAVRDGAIREGIALVSHYDSVPDGPGAADDALGIATCIESARLLARSPLHHSLFVIATDGEEVGLMGARAAVADPDVAARVKSVLNFDGTGAAGPAFMFQAGPGWAAPFDAWARSAVAPRGASFAVEIYRRLPNDTDFTVFRAFGAAGVNVAPTGDSYAYHTDRDVPARVDAGVVRQEITNTVAIVRALDLSTLTPTSESPTYFDLFGRRVIVMSSSEGTGLSWVACALGLLAWVLLSAILWHEHRMTGLFATAAWAIGVSAVVAAAMTGAVWIFRVATSELQPWYASPNRCAVYIALAGCLGGWVMKHVAALVPPRLRPLRTPASAWWVTLPVWIGLTMFMQITAASAAYLFAVPLVMAGSLVALTRRWSPLTRAASIVVFAVTAALWAGNFLLLLSFVVSIFGWLPIVPPVWLIPTLLACGAVALVPPFAAATAGWMLPARRSAGVGFALAALLVASGVLAFLSPAYTADRPQMRAARYIQDDIGGHTWWEVGGNESQIDLAEPGPVDAAWQRATGALDATVRIGSLGSPFVFRSPATRMKSELPATIRSQATRIADGRLLFDLFIVPREPLAVRLVLPPGLVPAASTIAGTISGDRWSATYVAPPASGLDVHLVFAGRTPADLQQTVVVLMTHGLPGAADASGRPAWLSNARAAWRTRSYFLVPAAPAVSR